MVRHPIKDDLGPNEIPVNEDSVTELIEKNVLNAEEPSEIIDVDETLDQESEISNETFINPSQVENKHSNHFFYMWNLWLSICKIRYNRETQGIDP